MPLNEFLRFMNKINIWVLNAGHRYDFNTTLMDLAKLKNYITNDQVILYSKKMKQYLKFYKHAMLIKTADNASDIYKLVLKTSDDKLRGKPNIKVKNDIYVSREIQIAQLEREIPEMFKPLCETNYRKNLFLNEEDEELFIKRVQEIDLNILSKQDSTEFFEFNETISASIIEAGQEANLVIGDKLSLIVKLKDGMLSKGEIEDLAEINDVNELDKIIRQLKNKNEE